MASITYGVDPTTKTTRYPEYNPTEGVVFCAQSTTAMSTPPITFSFTASVEDRSKAVGDKVHALPFTGFFRECVPVTGRFSILQHDTLSYGTETDVKYCGASRGMVASYGADIGYFINVAPTVPLPVPAAGVMERLAALSSTKALADLRRSLFNSPLLIAERKETVATLKKKGLQIAAIVRARQTTDLQRWVKTRSASKRRVAKDIAGEHLAILFGLLPLISEIEGIATALAADTVFKITGRGRAAVVENSKVDVGNDELPATSGYGTAGYYATRTETRKFSHRTSVSCTITSQGAQYLRDSGFNPIATFYDLVPLSFLSDFVSNLGTFLKALDPLVGVEFLTGSSTSWVERHDILRVVGKQKSRSIDSTRFLVQNTLGTGEGSTRVLRVERSVLTDYPEPSLMFVNNLSLAKVGTLASLAVQRYLKPAQRLFAVKAFRYKGPRPRNLAPINYR